jgi:hypothetical protein
MRPSLHDRIARDWKFVRSYTLKDGRLFLSLMADGGIYEFEPPGGSHQDARRLTCGWRFPAGRNVPKARSKSGEVTPKRSPGVRWWCSR